MIKTAKSKKYAVKCLKALVESAEKMEVYGANVRSLVVNEEIFNMFRDLIPYLKNSEAVVRCKDCEYYEEDHRVCISEWRHVAAHDFCSDGERRE